MAKDATTITPEMMAEFNRLKAENERLKADAARRSTIKFKVSEKGAVSVYGLGRFPVTLYREQWERLTSDGTLAGLRKFIADNVTKLSVKGDKA